MLNQNQISELWDRMLAAETRALYFADSANRDTAVKQGITFLTFFLSSGAAATIVAKAPGIVPITLAVFVALMSAYTFATNLDRRLGTFIKLHARWHRLADDYSKLWNHTYDEGAEGEYERISALELELSELATTELPKPDWTRLEHWQQNVFRSHHLKLTHE